MLENHWLPRTQAALLRQWSCVGVARSRTNIENHWSTLPQAYRYLQLDRDEAPRLRTILGHHFATPTQACRCRDEFAHFYTIAECHWTVRMQAKIRQ